MLILIFFLNGASDVQFYTVAGPAVRVLALLLYPIVWLLLLPFRLIGIGVHGVFELLRAVVLLPARILGSNPHR